MDTKVQLSGTITSSSTTTTNTNNSSVPTAAAAVIDYILDDGTDDKLKDLFDFYDADGNGMIQREELVDVLALCAHDIGLDMDAYLMELIVDAVFSNAKLTTCGSITFDGLKEVLKQRPNLINELSLAKRLASGEEQQRVKKSDQNTCNGFSSFAAKWESFVDCLSKRAPVFNKLRWEYISNNSVRFNFFLVIFFSSLALYVARIFSYWDSCGFIIVARASGQCLNFFCSIVVLLVCRRSISKLREKGYGRYLPLDDHIYFHKMIGMFVVGHSVLHTIGHIFNFMLTANQPESKFTLAEYLFSVHTGIGWVGGCASLTGWLLLIIITIMALAQPFSRSLGKFELFYYTHLLYIPFWVLLIVHAPNFWCWLVGPLSVFIVESIIRFKNLLTNLSAEEKTTIIKAVPLPSDVVHLVIKRPANFDYNPGDWIYVLVPQIAKYEWHPFTISSAPEQEGVIWLHIRAVGEWTKRLRSFFEGLEDRNHLTKFIKSGQFSISFDQHFGPTADLSPIDSTQILGSSKIRNKLRTNNLPLAPIPENKSVETIHSEATTYTSLSSDQSRDFNSSVSNNGSTCSSHNSSSSSSSVAISNQNKRHQMMYPNIQIFIDGPYGSPSSQIFKAEHAVLIATGIGVTPFASILQSIVLHYEKRRQKCPTCAHEFLDPRRPFEFKLRKVDFVWINRDQKSFEWFIKLLAELELTQSSLPPSERFLDIHIHLTSLRTAQTKSIGLQLALYLVHEKNKKDLVTGLRTRTKVGRPNWDTFFTEIEQQKKGKVSVFFCGRPQLGRLLHRHCDRIGFKFRKEIF